jgi:hypothetical protein
MQSLNNTDDWQWGDEKKKKKERKKERKRECCYLMYTVKSDALLVYLL